MAYLTPSTAFEVVQSLIDSLGLQEFPCGTGSWRETRPLKTVEKEQLKHKSHDKKPYCPRPLAVKAEKEDSDYLLDLISSQSSPWHIDCSWSTEAKALREIAVKTPSLINPGFIYSYFRTLQLVNKTVIEVDSGLLKLKNLEELILSANQITTVNSKCLPASLKVLELCANKIQDISDLCIQPPHLHHLGLGRNIISEVGNCISAVYWPHLVSLDLSHNNLCGLREIVVTLSTLPKLRNLLLQGNPLSLTPGYRGYTIDCLQDLTVFDDKQVSGDEKYDFRDLANMLECKLDEATVELGVTCIRGLTCPVEIKYPDSQPEFPIIERTYFVQFMFPMTQIADNMTEMESVSYVPSQAKMEECMLYKLPSIASQRTEGLESIELEENLDEARADSVPDAHANVQTPDKKDNKVEETDMMPLTKLVPINTQLYQWEQEMQLDWSMSLSQTDLLFLRDFFQEGMDVHIMEQIIEAYPLVAKISSEKKEDDKDKDKKRIRNIAKKRKKRKKKPTEEDLVKSPPTFTTIASFHFPLMSLLNGEYGCQNTFRKARESSQIVDMSKSNEDVSENLKVKKAPLPKSPPEKKIDSRKQSKDKDMGGKKIKGRQLTDKDSHEHIPLHLELELSVRLHHWLKFSDSYKDRKDSTTIIKMETVTSS